jgi:hypothetical protein
VNLRGKRSVPTLVPGMFQRSAVDLTYWFVVTVHVAPLFAPGSWASVMHLCLHQTEETLPAESLWFSSTTRPLVRTS